MESYIGTKIIKAIPMTDLEFEAERHIYQEAQSTVKKYQNGGHLLRYGRTAESNCEMRASREPKDGYKVMYPDGYTSWSPKEAFENSYRLIADSEKELIRR